MSECIDKNYEKMLYAYELGMLEDEQKERGRLADELAGPALAQFGQLVERSQSLGARLLRNQVPETMFLADTALFGSLSGTKCGLDFFGVDNLLFASDSPFDPEKGPGYIRETIKIIDDLDISEEDRHKIYEGNARRLLKI